MNVHYHKNFLKSYSKRIIRNLNLDKRFKDHALTGSIKGYRAFSVTGDVRVVYERVDDGVLLHDIGTHNQVY